MIIVEPAQQNDPRTRFNVGGRRAFGPGVPFVPGACSRAYKRTPVRAAPRNLNERARSRSPGNGARVGASSSSISRQRISRLNIDEERSEMRCLV
ncbi:hypothetical protein ACFX13_020658 [Malus domestica]